MELLAYAAAFYLWQCLAFLPEGAVVFRAPLRRFRVLAGEGARLLHPWPSAATLIGARLPIALEGEAVRSLVPSRRFGARASGEASVADLRSAAVSGCTITVAGKPFLRAATAEHASALGRLLRSMGGDPQASPHAVLLRFVRRSLSLARLRRDFAAADRATRWLGFGADVYAVLIFFVLPLLLVFVSPDAALLRVGPLIGVVHVVTVATLYLAHSRLYPAAGGARLELLVPAALFPPLLLRGRQDLLRSATADYHPAALAALVLDAPALEDLLRRELARLDRALAAAAERATATARLVEAEREALLDLAAQCGLAGELSVPRARRDPEAGSYCPLCLSDFRPGFGRCAPCDAATVAYAA
jgi:hypothetical protein